jgi:hypothetical protein
MPFLDAEIRIQSDGTLVTRYSRKPQNKAIILHSRSHHPESTKSEVLKNFYRTAVEVSSGPSELQHSLNIVDELERGNEYQPRDSTVVTSSRKRKVSEPHSNFCLYLNQSLRKFGAKAFSSVFVTEPHGHLPEIVCESSNFLPDLEIDNKKS